MEMMFYQQLRTGTYKDSLKVLEADIQHANALAAAIPNTKGGARLQMKLIYNDLAPLLYFFQWMDCSSTCFLTTYLNLFHVLVFKVYTDGRPISTHGRKSSIKDFYAIILPSLQRLHHDLVEPFVIDNENVLALKNTGNKRMTGDGGFLDFDAERADECGICLEPCTRIVLPNCCHTMCLNCYRDWNTRSKSCPFCRGSLRRVKSRDLWVLTCEDDVIDPESVSMEDLRRFYLYIRNLPEDSPDALFVAYYEFLI